MTDKQAYIRERTAAHLANGDNAVQAGKRCERDWRALSKADKATSARTSRNAAIAADAAAVAAATAAAAAAGLAPPVGPIVGGGDGGDGGGADDDDDTTTAPPTKIVGSIKDKKAKAERKLAAAANTATRDGRRWRGQHYLGGGTFGHAHLYLELNEQDTIKERMVVKDCESSDLHQALSDMQLTSQFSMAGRKLVRSRLLVGRCAGRQHAKAY